MSGASPDLPATGRSRRPVQPPRGFENQTAEETRQIAKERSGGYEELRQEGDLAKVVSPSSSSSLDWRLKSSPPKRDAAVRRPPIPGCHHTVVGGEGLLDHTLLAEAVCGSPLCCFTQYEGKVGVEKRCPESRSQSRPITGWNQQARFPVLDDIAVVFNVRCHNGLSGSQGSDE